MVQTLQRPPKRSGGFSVVEVLLVVVLFAGIAGIGLFVVHQKNKAENTYTAANDTASSAVPKGVKLDGSSASIDQLTKADAQSESAVDSNADSQDKQAATSANSALSSLGGSVDETSL